MPKLRRFGATNTPFAEENTTRPSTSMSPIRGRSSPAIERKVVVLPQPLGPKSVKSSPSGTSNDTSCAALTTWPLAPAYSVCSDLTLSTIVSLPLRLGDAEPPADDLCQHDETEQDHDHHDAER